MAPFVIVRQCASKDLASSFTVVAGCALGRSATCRVVFDSPWSASIKFAVSPNRERGGYRVPLASLKSGSTARPSQWLGAPPWTADRTVCGSCSELPETPPAPPATPARLCDRGPARYPSAPIQCAWSTIRSPLTLADGRDSLDEVSTESAADRPRAYRRDRLFRNFLSVEMHGQLGTLRDPVGMPSAATKEWRRHSGKRSHSVARHREVGTEKSLFTVKFDDIRRFPPIRHCLTPSNST